MIITWTFRDGMNIKVVAGKIFLAQNGRRHVKTHIHTCEKCLRFKQPQEKAGMQPILVSYLME